MAKYTKCRSCKGPFGPRDDADFGFCRACYDDGKSHEAVPRIKRVLAALRRAVGAGRARVVNTGGNCWGVEVRLDGAPLDPERGVVGKQALGTAAIKYQGRWETDATLPDAPDERWSVGIYRDQDAQFDGEALADGVGLTDAQFVALVKKHAVAPTGGKARRGAGPAFTWRPLGGNWVEGEVGRFYYQAKVFELPAYDADWEVGGFGSRISKLGINEGGKRGRSVFHWDRGADVRAGSAEVRAAVRALARGLADAVHPHAAEEAHRIAREWRADRAADRASRRARKGAAPMTAARYAAAVKKLTK